MTAKEFQSTILPAYGAMATTAQRLLGDDEIAKDVVQDVMRSLWEGRQRLQISTSITAYAIKTVKNRCIDYLRKHTAPSTSSIDEIADTIADVDDDNAKRIEMMIKAIEMLGEPRQTIIRLSLQGKSGVEIASTLKMNESTVRQHLSRSRKELRKLILQYENI